MGADLRAAIEWLDSAGRVPDSDSATLTMIAIAFLAVLVISWLLIALIERIVLRRSLRWSRALLSLLIAAAFWGSASAIVVDLVAGLAGRPSMFRYLIFERYLVLEPLLLIGLLVAPFMFNPFGLLGLLVLILYLVSPSFSRLALIIAVIITMTASSSLEVYYNHHPELRRS